jgi:hypothetical protein
MLHESIALAGELHVVLTSSDGTIKENRLIRNLVVNAGLAYITSRMIGTASPVMTHMGLGSGSTAAAPNQTDLVSLLGSREALDSATQSGSNNEKVVYVASFEPGDATGAIVEAGIFNASSAGTMLCRTVFAVVNKAVDDTLTLTWTITLAAV